MAKPPFPDRRGKEPPFGFEVLTGADLDPDDGRPDRWVYIGRIGRRSCIRSGFKTHEEACRAAWLAFDSACAVLAKGPFGAGMRARHIDPPGLPTEFVIKVGDYAHMHADLLAQIIGCVGSLRRAAKAIDVPKSTLCAWVKRHREEGTWPD